MEVLLRTAVVLLAGLLSCIPRAGLASDADFAARVDRVLTATPLIDAHNDLPWEIRLRFKGDLASFDLKTDWLNVSPPLEIDPSLTTGVPLQTDIPRLRAGHMGGQFWSIYVPVDVKGADAVKMALEQIDLVKRLAARYPADLEMAYSAADILRIHKLGRIASLIGIEGGHQIDGSPAVLRQMYGLGARYMTLTHFANTSWADSATADPAHHGLTPLGVDIVGEMNRVGMMIDLSHVSPETMKAALAISKAPVIFSHSSARALVDHPRNVPDDILRLVAQNGGVVMVNFYPGYVSEAYRRWGVERVAEQGRIGSTPPFAGLYVGQPDRRSQALAAWDRDHPKPKVPLGDVADHIQHIRAVAGVDAVGLGSDFDGMEDTPVGLEGVNRYPALLAELMRRGWSDADVAKVAGGNLLRVMASVERVAAKLYDSSSGSEAAIDHRARPLNRQ